MKTGRRQMEEQKHYYKIRKQINQGDEYIRFDHKILCFINIHL